ncbi:FAD/NAD(P)-binding domain-containing protein [Pisolithus croceorrhizus]|nr:FAD/NAD(P)-binding domain-containing protein [Pisolithus croceorrhizus]KAI6132449.1 FAD/NAD(P)-binding domain-containing protein [Pisolithus croceorrhizus]KAI6168773.1 FAD/NAD(P)-binding domain-containing protein [Pisolithus thermaeus]
MMASPDAVRRQSVGIIGAGAAGLVTAHTLLQDGFENVQLLTRDKSVGGVWERQRIYPGLSLNNVYGEFCFSSLPMPPPQNQKRLGGEDMCSYMEKFADTFLAGKIQFEIEVLNIRRAIGSGWEIQVQDLRRKVKKILVYDRIVLCTGGCSEPFIPESLGPDAAAKTGFHGLVCHSAEFARHLDRMLEDHKAIPDYSVLVVGCGKSAQDISALLARFGVKVTVVFEKTDAFLAYPIELPAIFRKSRFLSIMASHIELRTKLERFLHTTWLGGKITRAFWDFLSWSSYKSLNIPQNSPLRNSHSLFWGIRTNEEGAGKKDGFHALCNEGKIKLVAPARAVKYTDDGESVLLSNGTEIKANTVILATGFKSSWTNIFTRETAKELGIGRHLPLADAEEHVWDYTSFSNPPTSHPRSEEWVSSIYRGIVPARNINRRDFAINGAFFTVNNGYAFEVMAHWISSYFLGDKMRLPSSPEEATKLAGRNAAWMRRRFPEMLLWVNESYSSDLAFWSWPQAMDELLEDMGLPIMRSGGNWLTWPFKVITPAEIKNLREERRAKRQMDMEVVH